MASSGHAPFHFIAVLARHQAVLFRYFIDHVHSRALDIGDATVLSKIMIQCNSYFLTSYLHASAEIEDQFYRESVMFQFYIILQIFLLYGSYC